MSDARGLRRDVPVRVAYYAGTIAPHVTLVLTGDPASAEFVREQVARAVKEAAQLRPGAQVIVTLRRRSVATACSSRTTWPRSTFRC